MFDEVGVGLCLGRFRHIASACEVVNGTLHTNVCQSFGFISFKTTPTGMPF